MANDDTTGRWACTLLSGLLALTACCSACSSDSADGPSGGSSGAGADGSSGGGSSGSSTGAGGSTTSGGSAAVGSGGAQAGGGGDGSGAGPVAPSGGPRPCGCTATQLCAKWSPTQSALPDGVECWEVAAECLIEPPRGTAFSVCNCFDPCAARFPNGGTVCRDANSPGWRPTTEQDVDCVQGGS